MLPLFCISNKGFAPNSRTVFSFNQWLFQDSWLSLPQRHTNGMCGELCWRLLKLFFARLPTTISKERETGSLPLCCCGKIGVSELLRTSGYQPEDKVDAHQRAQPRKLKGKRDAPPLANGKALFPYCLSQYELGFLLLAAKNILTDSERQPKTMFFTY